MLSITAVLTLSEGPFKTSEGLILKSLPSASYSIFDVFNEKGTYTVYAAAVDSAGNYSTLPVTVEVTEAQVPL